MEDVGGTENLAHGAHLLTARRHNQLSLRANGVGVGIGTGLGGLTTTAPLQPTQFDADGDHDGTLAPAPTAAVPSAAPVATAAPAAI